MNFLASPTIVTAMAFSGKLSFNPITDSIPLKNGEFKFEAPKGQDLPGEGFIAGDISLYPTPNPQPQPETEIKISPTSQRLEILKPFDSHFGPHNPRGLELPTLKVLMRVRGKCTTDHISAAVNILPCGFLSCQGVPCRLEGACRFLANQGRPVTFRSLGYSTLKRTSKTRSCSGGKVNSHFSTSSLVRSSGWGRISSIRTLMRSCWATGRRSVKRPRIRHRFHRYSALPPLVLQ